MFIDSVKEPRIAVVASCFSGIPSLSSKQVSWTRLVCSIDGKINTLLTKQFYLRKNSWVHSWEKLEWFDVFKDEKLTMKSHQLAQERFHAHQ